MDLTDLARRLTADLARYLDLPEGREAVRLEGDGRGGVGLARIDLTGAAFDPRRARAASSAPARTPDLLIERLELTARPMTVEGVRVRLEGSAERVGLAVEGGPPRFVTLESGEVSGSTDRRELEAAAQAVVRELAAGYGVQVEGFRLELGSPQPHALEGRAWVRAGRRMLVANLNAAVEVAGRLEATPGGLALRNVTYRGDGPLSGVVSSLLGPYLRRLEGLSLALPVIPGRITDAEFEVGDEVSVRAALSG